MHLPAFKYEYSHAIYKKQGDKWIELARSPRLDTLQKLFDTINPEHTADFEIRPLKGKTKSAKPVDNPPEHRAPLKKATPAVIAGRAKIKAQHARFSTPVKKERPGRIKTLSEYRKELDKPDKR